MRLAPRNKQPRPHQLAKAKVWRPREEDGAEALYAGVANRADKEEGGQEEDRAQAASGESAPSAAAAAAAAPQTAAS